MAHLWLLLNLRIKLAVRRYTGQRGLFVLMLVAVLIMAALAVWISLGLARQHAELDAGASRRLFDLTALVVAAFLVLSPLMGFRGNEFMDVTKLFQYPIRPAWVFVSTVIGNFFSGTSLFLGTVLLVPAIARFGERTPVVVGATLLFLFTAFAAVQCLTLVFLNVLRSRVFRDLVAILAPVVGLGTYMGLRLLLFGQDASSTSTPELELMLDSVDLSAAARFLPPLWYSRLLYADIDPRSIVALAVLAAGLCVLGLHLTIQAFHGEIAIRAPRSEAREQRGALRSVLSHVLPVASAAVYRKELLCLKREPWFRMLFIQQLGFVVLICLGKTLWEGDSDSRDSMLWAGTFLLFIESGFLLNILGLEGPSIRQTAMLPVGGFRILLGKNVAHFHVLAVTNVLLIPALALLSSRLAHDAVPWDLVVVLTAVDVIGLPAVIATGNLLSILLPNAVGRRDRKVLGQERTHNEGCMSMILRVVFSSIAMIPAVIVACGIAAPMLFFDRGLDWTFWSISLPGGVLLAIVLYIALTVHSGIVFETRLKKIVARLS